MIVLDGKASAAAIRAEVKARSERFFSTYRRRAALAVLLVGDDPASAVYVRNKQRALEEAGISLSLHRFPQDAREEELVSCLDALAKDVSIDGILVQLPLPKHLNEERILAHIPSEKDVDGFSAAHMGALALKKEGIVPCTPLGIMELLRRYNIQIAGKRAVVVGRSNIVGRPMALLLLNADATVTVCHSKTVDLKAETLQADILIAAVGKPKFITGDMVKEGAVVVDVGMDRDENGALCGDVDFASVKEKAAYLTPVPGGVGPMTVAMLLQNVMEAAERAERK